MNDYRDVINSINEDINTYHLSSTDNGVLLNDLQKSLTTKLYYLSTARSDFHKLWQERVKFNIDKGSSVARAENLAHVDYPEMYELRKIIAAAYEVVWAVRSNSSYLKKEMETINNQ